MADDHAPARQSPGLLAFAEAFGSALTALRRGKIAAERDRMLTDGVDASESDDQQSKSAAMKAALDTFCGAGTAPLINPVRLCGTAFWLGAHGFDRPRRGRFRALAKACQRPGAVPTRRAGESNDGRRNDDE
jgi:hypothetical protein